MDDEIEALTVLLVGADGTSVGVVSRAEALRAAYRAGYRLVEVAPSAQPPVCRIVPPGEFDKQRRGDESRSLEVVSPEVRTLRFQTDVPQTDFRLKLRHGEAFLRDGGVLEIVVLGRRDAAKRLLERIADDLAQIASVEGEPKRVAEQLIVHLQARQRREANTRTYEPEASR